MTKSVSLLMLVLALDSVACVAQSTLGTDPVGAAGTPTALTTQPVSIATPDGGFVCSPETGDVYAGCPEDPSGAADGTPCALPTRTVCDYQTGTSAASYSCMPTAFGNRWSGAGIGDEQADCPIVRPAHGASCGATDFGRTCNYLRTPGCTCAADRNAPYRRGITCSCREDLGAWVCANDGQDGPVSLPAPPDAGAGGLPPFDESPCYGSPIALPTPPLDESKIINQLSNAEVAIWCGWYVATNQDGGPAPAGAPPWGGFSWCGGPDGLPGTCIADVPVAQCEQLVRLGSCEATVQALDDCYLTMVNECEVVGNGCETLKSFPSCLQTVVQFVNLSSPLDPSVGCPVPVH